MDSQRVVDVTDEVDAAPTPDTSVATHDDEDNNPTPTIETVAEVPFLFLLRVLKWEGRF